MESAWLSRLRANGIFVPLVVPNRDGRPETAVGAGPKARECVLFEWVRGRSLRRQLTRPAAERLGRLAARLHEDATDWEMATPPSVLAADRVLYWRLPRELPSAGAPYGNLFDDALGRAEADIDALWRDPPHPPHLLHGDLTPSNVLVSPSHGLVPVDFQDLVWGFDVQDLAITVAELERAENAAIIAAFRRGDEAARTWPGVSPAMFQSLIVARRLHTVNLTLAALGSAEREPYLAQHATRLRMWMASPEQTPRRTLALGPAPSAAPPVVEPTATIGAPHHRSAPIAGVVVVGTTWTTGATAAAT